MALNELYKNGDSLSWDVNAGVLSGDPVVFPVAAVNGSPLVGVAETGAVARENAPAKATIRIKGVFGFPYTGALAAGDPIYVSNAPAAGTGLGIKATLTATSTGNNKFGTVYETKAGGAGTAWILIGK